METMESKLNTKAATKTLTIWTIGHSTHSIEMFLAMLKSFQIDMVVDIRSMPGSRKFPQFDMDNLALSLQEVGVQYQHLTGLGGRRKAKKETKNTRWHNVSFRGYADYMETAEFSNAVNILQKIALKQSTAMMCSEAVWWRCHRSMVADYLKAKEWQVEHIMGVGKCQPHRYTAPARIVNGVVFYSEDESVDDKASTS